MSTVRQARQGSKSGIANRWLALEAACRGKDSVIIRRRLEKLSSNPEIDSPTVARESVRNSRPLLRSHIPFFFMISEGGKLSVWKQSHDIVSHIRIYNEKCNTYYLRLMSDQRMKRLLRK